LRREENLLEDVKDGGEGNFKSRVREIGEVKLIKSKIWNLG